MPTVHREDGLRFVIYSQDHPPPHVHVKQAGCELKIRLSDATITRNDGFTARQQARIRDIVISRRREFEDAWHGLFGNTER
jgi:hypothetical protein